MPEAMPVPYDAAMAARIKALTEKVDQRPSAAGLSGVAVFEINRLEGGWKNVKDDADKHQRLLVIPLLLRETRSYWARKGTGSPPDCRSIDGLHPVSGDDMEPQAATCAECPWNKFGTAEQGRGKKCKTKAVLFGLQVTPDAEIVGPVVLRFSLSNRGTMDAIQGADRAAAAQRLPRLLTVWACDTRVAKGREQDYRHFAPAVSGKVRPQDVQGVVEMAERLTDGGQAEAFLSAGPGAHESENE